MSGGGAGGKGAAAPVPAGSRKLVQSLKEIVNRPEAEIYAALRECGMDPDEAVSRLLSQGSGAPCAILSPLPGVRACFAVRFRVIPRAHGGVGGRRC